MQPSQVLSQDLQERCAAESYVELARRSVIGGTSYVPLFLILTLATPYRHDHLASIGVVGALLLTIGIARLILALHVSRNGAAEARRWRVWFLTGVSCSSLLWGIWTGITFVYYGTGWISFIAVLMTAGLVSGGITALAPNLKISRTHLFLMLLPLILGAATQRTTAGTTVALVVGMFLAYQFIQAGQ